MGIKNTHVLLTEISIICNERKKHVYNCHMILHSISSIFPSKYYLVFTLQEFLSSLLAGMLSNVHPCLNISVYLSINIKLQNLNVPAMLRSFKIM